MENVVTLGRCVQKAMSYRAQLPQILSRAARLTAFRSGHRQNAVIGVRDAGKSAPIISQQ